MSARHMRRRNVFRTKVLDPEGQEGRTFHRTLTMTDTEELPEYLANAEFDQGPLEIVFKRDARLPVWVGPGFVALRDVSTRAGIKSREVSRHLALGLLPGSVLTGHGWVVQAKVADLYVAARPWEGLPRRKRMGT
jgi:hypothetical protein